MSVRGATIVDGRAVHKKGAKPLRTVTFVYVVTGSRAAHKGLQAVLKTTCYARPPSSSSTHSKYRTSLNRVVLYTGISK